MSWSKDLVAASATPLVLAVLAKGENYGYQIIKQVKDLSREEIQWTDGMLYPVLHRLERQGMIESDWRLADSGRKRKYYRIKTPGCKTLQLQREQWNVVNDVLSKLRETKPCTT